MKFLRSLVAAILGYVIFAASVLAFFQLSGQPPHQSAPLSLMLGSILVGIAAAALGGYVAALIAGHRPVLHGALVATLLATGAIASLISTLGHGAIWSQLAALVLMAPSALAGGMLRARQSRRV